MDLVGQTLGRYRITDRLGQGRLATVYRAYEEGLDRWVALKVIDPAYTADPAFAPRFSREARAAARLRHPHILTLYDFGEHEGLAFLAMDYVEGGTLADYPTGQLPEWSDATALLLPVARALAYAHSQGVTHQNLKPANIFLARGDWPLVSDFGMMKMVGLSASLADGGDFHAPDYVSPEQAQAVGADARSDIYSLGAVLYTFVTGRKPFRGATSLDILMQHVNLPPESPATLNPSLPAAAEAIILRAMAKNPGARYQSMEELVVALQMALTHTTDGVSDRTYTPVIARHTTCPRCGADVSTLSRYCAKCGATLRSSTRSPTKPLPPRFDEPGDESATAGPHFLLSSGNAIALPPKSELTIGRADRVHQIYPDVDLDPHGGAVQGVSRLHAHVRRRGEAWVVEDAGSTNGTFLNGRRVTGGEEALLRHGDRLRCGQMVLTFFTA